MNQVSTWNMTLSFFACQWCGNATMQAEPIRRGDGEAAMDQPRTETGEGAGEARDKTPRTERGRRTLRKLLDAAAVEFGERGFHEASISAITRRAGTALGRFYTYFDSTEERTSVREGKRVVRIVNSRVRPIHKKKKKKNKT